ncbi:hypothetical protein OG497_37745 [Streptomyces sp. NBC_01242]|uniref:hypothetical protein n=1 Tax=Streptomyces sp. NBC_01242 TaxID=2903795 RepID=UPI00225C1E47|nr:hypothetical protein [Streptomyces sp. NBC_01242]MCX4799602.1 hypothetical protein [Streptomyces sp. NBC_01242]
MTMPQAEHGEPKEVRQGETFEEAWERYFDAHPEILASWRHQNAYWPMGYDDAA